MQANGDPSERGDDERDRRGSIPPADEGRPEPDPGEEAGPQGNPAQDEEALAKEQQDAADG